jgi:hypothetical protein
VRGLAERYRERTGELCDALDVIVEMGVLFGDHL